MKTPVPPTLSRKGERYWHREKNAPDEEADFGYYSQRKAWWFCILKHVSFAKIQDVHRGHGCPYCMNKLASAENCLARVYPAVAREWHPTKNGGLTPRDVVAGSGKRVWWLCAARDIWRARIQDRSVRRRRCPFCAGARASSKNNLAVHNPALAKEWHPWKNDLLTPRDVTPFSGRVVWWRCGKGHAFRGNVQNRQKGWSGCSRCKRRRKV